MGYSKSQLTRDLQRLDLLPLSSANDLTAWYRAAKDVNDRLKEHPQLEVPEFVWHYLADADIRSKDEGYSNQQRLRLREVIAELSKDG